MSSRLNPSLKQYGCHLITEEDIEAVVKVLKSDHLTCGQTIIDFEKEIADTVQAKYAVSCSNGTTALHLASLAAGVGPDQYVIVPSITFLATANAARYCGAKVFFSDVNPENGLMEPQHLRDAIAKCPKPPVVVYPVHLAGQPVNLFELKKIADQHGMQIIEDACHAIGTDFQDVEGQRIVGDGYYSHSTIFSFHPVKNIATGEGGAITTNDEECYTRMKCLRSHGMVREPQAFQRKDAAFDVQGKANPWYYEMKELGYNYRITDIQAALGLSQLKKLQQFKVQRAKLKQVYEQLLRPYESVVRPIRRVVAANPCWHLLSVLINFDALGVTRSQVIADLAARGIGSQVHYIPVHLQPYYQDQHGVQDLPGAAEYYRQTLSLPLHMKMSEIDVAIVVENLLGVLHIK